MKRLRRVKLILWSITGLAAAVGLTRFVFGLGATTNLSDAVPWGLWIGFDVLGGVALAAGGFVITATVYIFRREEYHDIVRPAVLTAFLGYIAVIVGLLFDLGLPWNIWHPVIEWQHHSALFEVAWCVMLYTTVLAMEFLPVPLESTSRWGRIHHLLTRIRLPLVILGIALSTLHQSSLGTLFVIMPHRLHPLWYSPILPVLFFISAISLGLMMVTFESLVSGTLYGRGAETKLLSGLGRAARWVLLFYLAVRVGDLVVRGQFGHAFEGSWQAYLFWAELSVAVFVPVVLLFIPRVRNSTSGLWWIATLGVAGWVINRIDVGGFARPGGLNLYLPAWSELAVSAGVVSAAALAFFFAIEHFNVWKERPVEPEARPEEPPRFDRAGEAWLGRPEIAGRIKYSLTFVVFAAVGFALLSSGTVRSDGMRPTPVNRARGGDTLWVDGNLDGYGVAFRHTWHQGNLGAKESCVLCHHMNLPEDKNSACSSCHYDQYLPADAFRHDWHSSPDGAKLGCAECHPRGREKGAEGAKQCAECHPNLVPAGAKIEVKQYQAPSYTNAMHGLCVACHQAKAEEVERPDLARCATCHKQTRFREGEENLAGGPRIGVGRLVVLPPDGLERQP